jgi:hypothetical protein
MDVSLIRQLRARAVFMAASTHRLFSTGRVPGIDASNSATLELTGEPNSVAAPENSFETLAICEWISRPTTLFHLVLGMKGFP